MVISLPNLGHGQPIWQRLNGLSWGADVVHGVVNSRLVSKTGVCFVIVSLARPGLSNNTKSYSSMLFEPTLETLEPLFEI